MQKYVKGLAGNQLRPLLLGDVHISGIVSGEPEGHGQTQLTKCSI